VYRWSSYEVLVPLILGFVGLAGFLFFESQPKLAPQPTVPLHVMSNRTSATGFVLAFIQTMAMIWPLFFLPVYFQGVLKSSTTMSGVKLLPSILALIPGTAVGGAVMNKTGRYRPVQHVGFALVTIGFGLYSMLDEHSSTGWWVGFQILFSFGVGSGMLLHSLKGTPLVVEYSLTSCFPVMPTMLPGILAPLAESDTALATAFCAFLRSFGLMVCTQTHPCTALSYSILSNTKHATTPKYILIACLIVGYCNPSRNFQHALRSACAQQDHGPVCQGHTHSRPSIRTCHSCVYQLAHSRDSYSIQIGAV
jgi:hypothetical protein